MSDREAYEMMLESITQGALLLSRILSDDGGRFAEFLAGGERR